MKMTKEQTDGINEITDVFRLELEKLGIAEEFDVYRVSKEDRKEITKPKTQIEFGNGRIEIMSQDNLKNTSKAMIQLMNKFQRIVPNYIG